jgi:hypothetical protein
MVAVQPLRPRSNGAHEEMLEAVNGVSASLGRRGPWTHCPAPAS